MKLKRISEASMQEIVKAFSEYQYEAQEEGLYYLCKGKSGTEAYMKGFALAGIKSGWLHTISEKEEGYIMISEPTSKVCFGGLKDLILGIVKGMGLKGSIQFFKDMKASGTSLESKLKEAHQDFVQIEMLVVKRAYPSKFCPFHAWMLNRAGSVMEMPIPQMRSCTAHSAKMASPVSSNF